MITILIGHNIASNSRHTTLLIPRTTKENFVLNILNSSFFNHTELDKLKQRNFSVFNAKLNVLQTPIVSRINTLKHSFLKSGALNEGLLNSIVQTCNHTVNIIQGEQEYSKPFIWLKDIELNLHPQKCVEFIELIFPHIKHLDIFIDTVQDYVVNQILIEMLKYNIPYQEFVLHFFDVAGNIERIELNEHYDLVKWPKEMFDVVENQFLQMT